MSEFPTSHPMFFSWQLLGSSGQRFQISTAASRSWLSYCFSTTFNLARGAILKCGTGLYFGVASVAAVAPRAAAAGSGGRVASAAPPAGPAVFLVVL